MIKLSLTVIPFLLAASTCFAASASERLAGTNVKAAKGAVNELIRKQDYELLCSVLDREAYKDLWLKIYIAKSLHGRRGKGLVRCLSQSLRRHNKHISGGEIQIAKTELLEALVADLNQITKKSHQIKFWDEHPRMRSIKVPRDTIADVSKVVVESEKWADENDQ